MEHRGLCCRYIYLVPVPVPRYGTRYLILYQVQVYNSYIVKELTGAWYGVETIRVLVSVKCECVNESPLFRSRYNYSTSTCVLIVNDNEVGRSIGLSELLSECWLRVSQQRCSIQQAALRAASYRHFTN